MNTAQRRVKKSQDTTNSSSGLNRREFLSSVGTGLLVTVMAFPAFGQRSGARGGGTVAARVHLGKDGMITVLTGKVEGGQGARTELTQAASEELRVPLDRINLVMADTDLVPDDGLTAGSRTTPSTVPAVRRGAAAARDLLIAFAAKQWGVDRTDVVVIDGKARHKQKEGQLDYSDFAGSDAWAESLKENVPNDVSLTPLKDWKALGITTPRRNARDLVLGTHKFPSDISRPGMLYGRILRPPSFGAVLQAVDLAPAQAMKGVTAMREEQFAGVVAPTSFQARQAVEALEKTAQWQSAPHPSSNAVHQYLIDHARGGMPQNPFGTELEKAKQVLRQQYQAAYVQHAPLEPRAAVAEWNEGKLTVWTGTQNPFGYRAELARAFKIPENQVRVIVPDFGSGFGGKHTAEAAIEAARLAKAAGRPVSLRWTREEEFTWAYFRPAAVIRIEASLDDQGSVTSWHFINVNSGGAALDAPYEVGHKDCKFVPSDAPLRQGSYRALAAPVNTFARECFMDELAAAAGKDPLEFRLAHLKNERLRAVLETAAKRFEWTRCVAQKSSTRGVGLACGTEKGSYAAACVEIELTAGNSIRVTKVCEVFECGAILNPGNLQSQVEGQIMMALGPALREEMVFEGGKMLNASFRRYHVPRLSDIPEMDVHLLNRPDIDSAGGGETPTIPVAPAIANAVFHARGIRLRSLPLKFAT